MIIKKIETLRPKSHPSTLWILLHDEQGNVGLGETFFSQSVIEEYVHAIAAPLIFASKDVSPESLALFLTPYVGFQAGGVEMRSLGGIDIAVWDLMGKRLNTTVVDLLGGAVRDEIKIYNTCAGSSYMKKTSSQNSSNWGVAGDKRQPYEDLDAFFNRPAELARELFDSGIKGMKIWPFDKAAERTNGASISRSELNAALSIVSAVRTEVGMEMDLMIELHGLWLRSPVEMIMNELKQFDPFWVEDPLRVDAVDALSNLRSATGMRIATGETATGRRSILPLLQRNAVDIVTMDVQWCGGLTEARKMASLADTFATPFAPHDCTGPVSLAACTHLVLSQKNALIQETSRAFINTWYRDFVDGTPEIVNGHISATKKVGHGVTMQEWVFSSEDVFRRVSKRDD